jgi:hypothetical protein
MREHSTLPPDEDLSNGYHGSQWGSIDACRSRHSGAGAAGILGDNNEITFQIDRNSRLPLIRIIDRTTNKVVERIPAEYILQLAESLGKSESGTLSAYVDHSDREPGKIFHHVDFCGSGRCSPDPQQGSALAHAPLNIGHNRMEYTVKSEQFTVNLSS